MNLVKLRALVLKCSAGRAAGLQDDDLDEVLNLVYQVQLPNRIDGPFRNETIRWTLEDGKDVYTYEEIGASSAALSGGTAPLIRTLGPGLARVDQETQIDYYERAEEFWARWLQPNQSSGGPMGYLAEYDQVTLRPVPTEAWEMLIPATVYRQPLTETGIADEEEARTVAYGATIHLAIQENWDALIEKYNLAFTNGSDALQRRSRGRKRRAPIREDY